MLYLIYRKEVEKLKDKIKEITYLNLFTEIGFGANAPYLSINIIQSFLQLINMKKSILQLLYHLFFLLGLLFILALLLFKMF